MKTKDEYREIERKDCATIYGTGITISIVYIQFQEN